MRGDARRWFAAAVCIGLAAAHSRAEEVAAQKPAAQEAAVEETPANLVPLTELLQVKSVANEEALRAVAQALSDPERSGAAEYAQTKEVRLLAIREAALQALKRNLDIKVSTEEAKRVERAIDEAEAVFNPVFRVSVGYSYNTTLERARTGTVFVQPFLPFVCGVPPGPSTSTCPDPTPLPVPDANGNLRQFHVADGVINIPVNTNPALANTPQVDLLAFIQERGGVQTKRVFASKTPPDGPKKTLHYDLGVDQQLPWGPAFRVRTFTTDRDTFYTDNHSFDRDFATSMVFDLLLPLPGTKDFGPNARADVNVRLAEKAAERSDWDVRTVINNTLLDSDAAYWALVRTVEDLRVVMENRKLMQQVAERTQRLFDLGGTTAFGKAQVDAELARLEVLEESAKVNVINVSNQLALIIEQSGQVSYGVLYLPSDYRPQLENLLVLDTGDAVQQAMRYRPDLAAEHVSKQSSEIAVAFNKQQLRPDLSLTTGIVSSQNDTEFGYKDYAESMGAIADPDQLNQSYSLTYVYPLRNRAAKARYQQALKLDESQGVSIRSLENDIIREVNDALANVYSARERIELAEKNVKYANEAYQKLLQRRAQGGDVRETELIAKSQDALNAESARIAALIDNKLAESQFLAAQGLIAANYGQATAQNGFEQARLDLLSGQAELRYFAPMQGDAGTDLPVAGTR